MIVLARGVFAALLAATVLVPAGAGASATPAGFRFVLRGPAGGTVWTGRIPNSFADDARFADLYLPPGYTQSRRYPVLYLLHGFWGSPGSFVHGLRFAQVADLQITRGKAAPFIAVMPPGGPKGKSSNGEWAGVWEDYVVRDVVPWVDHHFATDPTQRALAGLSAGGYGAIDIGLRHLRMFKTLESWGGYFRPFRDGPFVHATRGVLDAHDPELLARRERAALIRAGVRVFLSTGTYGHGPVAARWTVQFAHELSSLDVQHLLVVEPRRIHFVWRAQLPAAIDYALPATSA